VLIFLFEAEMNKIHLVLCGMLGASLCFGAVHATGARNVPRGSQSGLLCFYKTTNGRFEYVRNSGGSVTITAYLDDESVVSLPGEIGLFHVTEIGARCFEECENLRVVQIPASVKKLGSGAFHRCAKLELVVFLEGSELEEIGSWAFGNTPLRKSVLFHKCLTLREIGE
jgi:hypothetical protein